MKIIDFKGKELWKHSEGITVKANASEIVYKKALNELLKGIDKKRSVLVVSLTQGDKEIYRTTKYFNRVKDLDLPMPRITAKTEKTADGVKVTVTTNVLAKNVYVSFEDHEGWFTDNFFDMLPGETRTVVFETNEDIADPAKELKVRSIRDTY